MLPTEHEHIRTIRCGEANCESVMGFVIRRCMHLHAAAAVIEG